MQYIINSLDGNILNENADYYLTEYEEPCQGQTIIYSSWIYALQFSSCYFQPFLFIIYKKINKYRKKTKSKGKSVLSLQLIIYY